MPQLELTGSPDSDRFVGHLLNPHVGQGQVFTIASGVFDVTLPTLIFASFLGRGARFMLVATAIFFFGPTVKVYLDKYFGIITFALLALLIGGFAAVKFLI